MDGPLQRLHLNIGKDQITLESIHIEILVRKEANDKKCLVFTIFIITYFLTVFEILLV